MVKVSVVMPVFNGGEYLRKAVDSILLQTFSDFEFLIVNDGSTDASGKILQELAKRDQRIKVIDRENRGLIYSLNEACGVAEGEYIARMDADDISLKDRFEQQVNYLDSHPEVVACGTEVTLIDGDGLPIKNMGNFYSHSDIDQQHMAGQGGAIIHPSAMIRRTALLQVGAYCADYSYAEDLDLWLRLAEKGRLANLDLVLLYYRQHTESIGTRKREAQYHSARKAVVAAHLRRGVSLDKKNIAKLTSNPTPADLYLKWGWWSLGARNVATARKYARKRILVKPFSLQSLKLVFASVRGY